MPKDLSFARFFNPQKSPSGGFDVTTGRFIVPKHRKYKGHTAWDSFRKGTYVRSRDGELR